METPIIDSLNPEQKPQEEILLTDEKLKEIEGKIKTFLPMIKVLMKSTGAGLGGVVAINFAGNLLIDVKEGEKISTKTITGAQVNEIIKMILSNML